MRCHDWRVRRGQNGGVEARPSVPGGGHGQRQGVPQHQVPAATIQLGPRR